MNTIIALKKIDILVIIALCALTLFSQHYIFFNLDASWHVIAAERILAENAAYHTNLVDDNLPMVFWYFIPTVLVHQLTHINIIILAKVSILITFLISFFLTNTSLKTLYDDTKYNELRIMRYALLFVFLLTPGFEYGQRDILVTYFIFPYIALTAADIKKLTKKPRILIGCWAAVGCMMNPFYALVIIALTVQSGINKKSLQIFKPQLIAFILCMLIYFSMMGLFYHDYFTYILPIIFNFYGAYKASFLTVFFSFPSLFFCIITIVFFLHFLKKQSQWHLSLWLSILAGYIVFLLHEKLWESHFFFYYMVGTLLFIAILTDIFINEKNKMTICLSISIVFLSGYIMIMSKYFAIAYGVFLDPTSQPNQLIQFLDKKASTKGTLYVLSYAEFTSAVMYSNITYLNRGPNLWMTVKGGNMSSWGKKQHQIEMYRILSDLLTEKPSIILIDNSAINKQYLNPLFSFLNNNPVFQTYWKQYHLDYRGSNFEIYIRETSHSTKTSDFLPHQ